MRRFRTQEMLSRSRRGLMRRIRGRLALFDGPETAPTRPWIDTGALVLDVVAFNTVFYCFIRALLFSSVGAGTRAAAVGWGLAFAGTTVLLMALRVQGRRQDPLAAGAIFASCLAASLVIAALVRVMPSARDPAEFSWAVAEIIKTPLWAKLIARTSPLAVGAFAAVVLAVMRWTAGGGGRWLLATAAAVCAVAATTLYARVYTVLNYPTNSLFWVLFDIPLFLVSIAAAVGWIRLAFRATPFALYALLMGLSYTGLLPVHTVGDLMPWTDAAARYVGRIPGARLLYRPDAAEARTDFRFPRKLFRLGDEIVLVAGPMGNTLFFVLDAHTGEKLHAAVFRGLIRDMIPKPNGAGVWGVNWEVAELLDLDPETLRIGCHRRIFSDKIRTPWSMELVGDRLYLTNVTLPVLAEFILPSTTGACGATLARQIDFHEIGYTAFTDGAFGVHVDPVRNAVLATVGMLEGRYEIGLVEIGLDDFAIRRDLRLRAGVTIFPVPGTRRVLLTSYYDPAIFEVDLDRWEVTRTIHAAPNIFSLAFDEARRLIYVTSRIGGVLQVIDYESGRLRREDVIGNKSEPLFLDGDRLLVASQLGVIEIDLAKYVGPATPR